VSYGVRAWAVGLLLAAAPLAAQNLVARAAARVQTASPGPLLTFNIVDWYAIQGPPPELRNVTIVDDGKRMPAAFCLPADTPEASAPLQPREYSNRTIRSDSHTILVVLDLPTVAGRGLAWDDAADAIRKLGPRQRVFVYAIGSRGELYPIRAFPGAEGPPPPPADETDWTEGIPERIGRAVHEAGLERLEKIPSGIEARARSALLALQDLASYLAVQPGSKSLVWLSHAVPVGGAIADGNWHDYTSIVEQFGTDLARAGIALYAVDARRRAADGLAALDILRQLAGITAGQWFAGSAIAEAIRQAVADTRYMYQVGYIPPPDRWDNRFHRLQVTAEIRGNLLRMRSPEGYFGDARRADPRQRSTLAVVGPADDAGIGIRAAIAPSDRGQGWMHFEVRVNPGDLRLTNGDASTGAFRVSFAHYADAWQADSTAAIEAKLHLGPENRDNLLRDGVAVTFDRPLPSGARKMRIVVSDERSEAVGSLTIPLAAPSRP